MLLLVAVPELTPTTIAILSAGVVALVGYVALIVAPAWSSYGRLWERCAAAFLTLYILATLLALGAIVGFGIAWYYDLFAST